MAAIENKVDAILNYLSLEFQLLEASTKKNNSLRAQDFETALKHRKDEVSLQDKLMTAIKEIYEMVNLQSPQTNQQ